MKSTYYVASSLDGFIATESGGVEWLDKINIDESGSTYESFYAGIDGLIIGSATYQFVLDYGSWPYDDQPCWVVSSRSVDAIDGCNLQAQTDLDGAWESAKAKNLNHLWVVGGGQLARSLIQQNLLTHIQVSIMPIILGTGIRLVDVMPEPTFLTQERSVSAGGLTEILYKLG